MHNGCLYFFIENRSINNSYTYVITHTLNGLGDVKGREAWVKLLDISNVDVLPSEPFYSRYDRLG